MVAKRKFLQTRGAVFLLFLVSICVNLCFTFFFPHDAGDTPFYDRVGWNIAQGNGFSMSEEPPYEPYFKKPLGYPLFLAFFYVLFGHHFLPVYIAQSILAAVTVVFLFLIAQILFDRITAFIAGMVIALNPLIGYFCSTIMTEVSFTFFFVLGIYFLMKFRDKGRYVYLYPALAGILIGIATIIRPMTQYLPFFFAGVLCLLRPSKRLALRQSAILIVSYAIIVLPWVLRTNHLFGEFKLSTIRASWSMYSASLEYRGESWEDLLERDWSDPDAGIIMNSTDFEEVEAAYMRFDKKLIANIRAEPWLCFRTIPIRFFRNWVSSYHPGMPKVALLVIQAYGIIYLVLGILGILLTIGIWRETIWILLPMLYMNSISSLLITTGRYTIPLKGFMAIFIGAALIYGWRWMRGKARGAEHAA